MVLAPLQRGTSRSGRNFWLALSFSFLALIPNPSFGLGGEYFRLRFFDCLVLLFGIAVLASLSLRGLLGWLLFAVPVCITGAYHLSVGGNQVREIQNVVAWLVATSPLLISLTIYRRSPEGFWNGISVAILVHGAVSLLQMLTFADGSFPIWKWYPYGNSDVTPALGQLKFIRAFGLFNEPSEMAAALSPWILALGAWRLGLCQLTPKPRRLTRFLRDSAAIVGSAAMLWSRSAHLFAFGAGAMVLVMAWALRLRTVAGRMLGVLAGIAIAVTVCAVAVYSVNGRDDAGNRTSWSMRGGSIIESVAVWWSADVTEILIGQGDVGARKVKEKTGYNVWSIVAKGVVAFGFLFVLSWLVILRLCLMEIRRAGDRVTRVVFLCVLVFGMMFTCSNERVVSLWFALGCALGWFEIISRRSNRQAPWRRCYGKLVLASGPGVSSTRPAGLCHRYVHGSSDELPSGRRSWDDQLR